jgi:hypothetical protein
MILNPVRGAKFRKNMAWLYNCAPMLQRFRTGLFTGAKEKIWRERGMASAPQSHGAVVAAGCQKRRRRVKRHRANIAAVPRQSRHASRRRVVAGQQPQSHGVVAAAGCQKRRRRVRGNLLVPMGMPKGYRYVSHQRRQMNTTMHSFYVLEMKKKM